MRRRRCQPRGLVHAELVDHADPTRVVHQRGAVLDHRRHHRPPAHPELLCHLRNRAGVLAHLAGRLHASALGQQRPEGEPCRRLGPGPGIAVGLHATPAPLVPHQPCRAPEAGQVPDLHDHAVLCLGPGAAGRTTDHHGCGLDADDQLVRVLGHLQHPKPVQSQKRLGQPGTVLHAGVSSRRSLRTATTMAGPLPRVVDPQLPAAPHFIAKSQLSTTQCPRIWPSTRLSRVGAEGLEPPTCWL